MGVGTAANEIDSRSTSKLSENLEAALVTQRHITHKLRRFATMLEGGIPWLHSNTPCAPSAHLDRRRVVAIPEGDRLPVGEGQRYRRPGRDGVAITCGEGLARKGVLLAQIV